MLCPVYARNKHVTIKEGNIYDALWQGLYANCMNALNNSIGINVNATTHTFKVLFSFSFIIKINWFTVCVVSYFCHRPRYSYLHKPHTCMLTDVYSCYIAVLVLYIKLEVHVLNSSSYMILYDNDHSNVNGMQNGSQAKYHWSSYIIVSFTHFILPSDQICSAK